MVRFVFAAAGAAALHCRKSTTLSKGGKNVLKCDWGNGYKVREAFCEIPKKKDKVCTLTDDEWSLLANKAVKLRYSYFNTTKRSYTMDDGTCQIQCEKCGVSGQFDWRDKAFKLTCWELQEGPCNAQCFKKGFSDGTWKCSTGTDADCAQPKPSDKRSVCTNLDSACPRWELKQGTCSEKCGRGTAVNSFYCSTGVDSDCTLARPKEKTVKCIGNDPTCHKHNFRFAAMVVNSSQLKVRWSAREGQQAIRELKHHVKEMRKIFIRDSWGVVRIMTNKVPNKVIDIGNELDNYHSTLEDAKLKLNTVEDQFRSTVELEHAMIAKQQRMIDRAGVDVQLETFDLYFMLHPNMGDSLLGLSYFNNRTARGDCRATETNASLKGKILVDYCSKVMAHELYHSFGLRHASGLVGGTSLEYGHRLDIMGNNDKTGMKYLGLPMRYKMGWAPRSQLHLVTDLTKEQTFDFAPFEKKTSDFIGIMIPLECTSVFISRDEEDNFLVEYSLQNNNNPAISSAHRAVQDKGNVEVGDRVYEPMADLTIERTAQGARLYTGRQGVTHADTDLVSDVLSHRLASKILKDNCGGNRWCQRLMARVQKDQVPHYVLTKRFEKGCPALRQPDPSRTCGKAPGYAVNGMFGERGVIYRRAHRRHEGIQRYECHDGVWMMESGHFRQMRR